MLLYLIKSGENQTQSGDRNFNLQSGFNFVRFCPMLIILWFLSIYHYCVFYQHSLKSWCVMFRSILKAVLYVIESPKIAFTSPFKYRFRYSFYWFRVISMYLIFLCSFVFSAKELFLFKSVSRVNNIFFQLIENNHGSTQTITPAAIIRGITVTMAPCGNYNNNTKIRRSQDRERKSSYANDGAKMTSRGVWSRGNTLA